MQAHPLESCLICAWPMSAWLGSHLVVAVSGGADSVGLLRAILAIKQRSGGAGKVFVAHFNHCLRGAAADDDAAWLTALCHELEVQLEIGRADAPDMNGFCIDTSEAASRAARYHFLRETAERRGARYVAVAHTADDQVETILHRILRGTGLEGLAGMPQSRPLSPSVALVRPLLAVRRAAVLQYLQDIGQSFRIDDSNSDFRWTRNRLRHELLPAVREQYNTGVDDALLRLAAQAGEAQSVIEQLAGELASRCVRIESSPTESSASVATRTIVNCWPLRASAPLLVREVCKLAWKQAGWPLQAMGSEEWQRMAELVHEMQSSPTNLPCSIQARREGHMLILESHD